MLKRRRRRRKRGVIRRDGVRRRMMMMIVRGMVRPFLHWQREMTPPTPPNHPIHPLTHPLHHPTLKHVAMISMQTEAATKARMSIHPKKLVSVLILPRMTTCLPPVVMMTMMKMWIMSLVMMMTDPPVVEHPMTCPISLVEMNPVILLIRLMILLGIPCRHCLLSVCRRSRRLERRRMRQLQHLQRKRQRQCPLLEKLVIRKRRRKRRRRRMYHNHCHQRRLRLRNVLRRRNNDELRSSCSRIIVTCPMLGITN
mmetsp:Transcript_7623/g.11563  ORF Transcript_7623/g.11563 Transcript_7623/m.11563 type:complete len:254 (-) Transcript_7623:166-927(-)